MFPSPVQVCCLLAAFVSSLGFAQAFKIPPLEGATSASEEVGLSDLLELTQLNSNGATNYGKIFLAFGLNFLKHVVGNPFY